MHMCNVSKTKGTTRKVSIIDETRKVKTKLEGKCRIKEPKLGKLKKDLKDNKILKNFFVFHNADPNSDVFVYKIVQDETVYETIRNQTTVSSVPHAHQSTPTKESPSPSISPTEPSNCSEFLNIASYLSSLPLNSIDQIDVQTLKSIFGFNPTQNESNSNHDNQYCEYSALFDQDEESTFL